MEEPIQRLLHAAGTERWRVIGTEVGTTWALDSEPYGCCSPAVDAHHTSTELSAKLRP